MTTASSVIERARRRLTGTQRDVVNQLGVGCSATAGEITLSFDASEFTPFSVLEIDLELMLVISTNGQRITVLRGYGGTNSDNHDAGALVRSAPVVYAADIFEAMNDELRDLSSPLNGLFRVEPIDFSMSVEEAYDLAATEQVLGLAKVEYREINTYKQWRKVCNPRLTLDASTDDFPSGVSLALQGVGIGRQVRVWVKTAFSSLGGIEDDVEETSGLHPEAIDILWMGAVLKCTGADEIARNRMGAQGDPRRAEEVPPGALNAAPSRLAQMRRERIKAEAARLQRLWGF